MTRLSRARRSQLIIRARWGRTSGFSMGRRLRLQDDDGLFGFLDENLVLNILDKIHDRADRQAWCLVCRRFLQVEATSRKKIQLLRVEMLEDVLGRYKELQELDLSLCLQVSDTTLETVGRISGQYLRSINLAYINQFSEAGLFKLLNRCASLRELDLSFCSGIADCGMEAVAQLKTLESLKLVNCRYITDTGLGYVSAGCKNLRHLSLRWCLGITDSGISFLAANCKRLESLDLSSTEVTSRGLKSITGLQSLKNLILASCERVDDAGLAYLNQCRDSLVELDVARCLQVSEGGIIALASGPVCLQQLILSYCLPISRGLLASFAKLESLQVIRLDGCKIEGNALAFIGRGWKSLKEFSVSKCRGVTDEGICAVVKGSRDLQKLDLTCCRELTDLAVASIARSCHGLLSLKMEACSLVTGKGFALLGKECSGLEELDLTDCSINDEGLTWIARCTALRILKLGYCPNISDKGIAHIGDNCRYLWEIDLYRSLGIGDSSVAAVANGCPRLKVLNFSYCGRITDASLHCISRLQDLTQLQMRACVLVTSKGLSSVATGCKRLVELDIKHCTTIDDAGLLSIAEGCPNLREVNLSFCKITDVGLLALSRLRCLQYMKLLGLSNVTVKGLTDALHNCRSLKKVKLPQCLQMSDTTVQYVQARGCKVRWLDKPGHTS